MKEQGSEPKTSQPNSGQLKFGQRNADNNRNVAACGPIPEKIKG
jgi:hypothetical protein